MSPNRGYHRSYPVPPDLRPFVRRLFVVNAPMEEAIHIPASHRTYLFVHFGPTVRIRNRLAQASPGIVFLSGPATRPFMSHRLGARFHFLAADFTPLGVHALFRTSLVPLRDQLVPLDVIAGDTRARTLQHEIAELPTDLQRVDCIVSFLRERVPCRQPANARHAERFLVLANADPGRLIAEFTRDLGLSAPLLRRSVSEVCGLSPKALLTSARLGLALTHLVDGDAQAPHESPSDSTHPEAGSLTSLAHDLKFYDQAHFSRAFRQFTGFAPSRLPREAFLLARLMM